MASVRPTYWRMPVWSVAQQAMFAIRRKCAAAPVLVVHLINLRLKRQFVVLLRRQRYVIVPRLALAARRRVHQTLWSQPVPFVAQPLACATKRKCAMVCQLTVRQTDWR